jgi:hypothetical protein
MRIDSNLRTGAGLPRANQNLRPDQVKRGQTPPAPVQAPSTKLSAANSSSAQSGLIKTLLTLLQKLFTQPAGNPFAGQPGGPAGTTARQLTAPSIPPPPPMTNTQGSISLGTNVDSVLHNSARSVQITNAKYNEQAYESYNKAVKEWQDNGGRRWIGGNTFAYTPEPPPVPHYLPTDHSVILADIAAHYKDGRPVEDVNAKRPYYMGGSIFFNTKVS